MTDTPAAGICVFVCATCQARKVASSDLKHFCVRCPGAPILTVEAAAPTDPDAALAWAREIGRADAVSRCSKELENARGFIRMFKGDVDMIDEALLSALEMGG